MAVETNHKADVTREMSNANLKADIEILIQGDLVNNDAVPFR